jgi:hypothetical protein
LISEHERNIWKLKMWTTLDLMSYSLSWLRWNWSCHTLRSTAGSWDLSRFPTEIE